MQTATEERLIFLFVSGPGCLVTMPSASPGPATSHHPAADGGYPRSCRSPPPATYSTPSNVGLTKEQRQQLLPGAVIPGDPPRSKASPSRRQPSPSRSPPAIAFEVTPVDEVRAAAEALVQKSEPTSAIANNPALAEALVTIMATEESSGDAQPIRGGGMTSPRQARPITRRPGDRYAVQRRPKSAVAAGSAAAAVRASGVRAIYSSRPESAASASAAAAARAAAAEAAARIIDKGDWLAGAQLSEATPQGANTKARERTLVLAEVKSEFLDSLVPKGSKWQKWWGDHIMDRVPEVQMRPPSALPRPPPSPRPKYDPSKSRPSTSRPRLSERTVAAVAAAARPASARANAGGAADEAPATCRIKLTFSEDAPWRHDSGGIKASIKLVVTERQRPTTAASFRSEVSLRAKLVGGRPARMPKAMPRSRLSQQDVYNMLNDPTFDPEAAEKAEKARRLAEERSRRRVALLRREAKQAEEARQKAEAAADAKERARLLKVFGLSDMSLEDFQADAEVAAMLQT